MPTSNSAPLLSQVVEFVRAVGEASTADVASRFDISRPYAGQVLITATRLGMLDRRTEPQTFGGGKQPFLYFTQENTEPVAVEVTVDVPEEVTSKPEPEEVYETVGEITFRKNSAAHRVASRIASTVKMNGRFTVNGIHDQLSRTSNAPTRGAVQAGVDKLVGYGYVVKTDKQRHYSDGRAPVFYYRYVKALPITPAPRAASNGDVISALRSTVKKTVTTPTPALGLVAQTEALITQRNELDAELTRLTDELANTSAARDAVIQELEASKNMLLSL